MATCKDCFHFEVCDSGRHIGEYIEDDGVYTDGVEKECPAFKSKADYVEVKHGEWVEIEHEYRNKYETVMIADTFICSECGITLRDKYPYCHNCGAKMDGGKAE